MTRHATLEDISRLSIMAGNFVKHSPYWAMGTDLATVEQTLASLITSPMGYLGVTEAAMLGGMAVPLFFNERYLIASEMFLWSEAKGDASALIDHFEAWAREIGATVCGLTMLEGEGQSDPSKLYERKGFLPTERGYQKVL